MLLTVGRIVRPHGVRGEVVVEVRTDEPSARYAVGAVLDTGAAASGAGSAAASGAASGAATGARSGATIAAAGGPARLTVAAARPHHGRLIVSFREVPDRAAAEALRGTLLQVDSDTVTPPSDPDEFADHQLVGLAAVSPAGEPLGEVARIDHAPAADLLVLHRPGGRTALVPFVGAIVPEVDLAGGRIIIDPPPGLLDL